MFNRLRRFVLLVGLFLVSTSAYASLVFDFAGALGRSCLRMVVLDTQRHALVHYETMPLQSFQRPLRSFLTQVDTTKLKDPELDYMVCYGDNDSLTIRAPSGYKRKKGPKSSRNYLFLTNTSMKTIGLKPPLVSEAYGSSYWVLQAIQELSPEVLETRLPSRVNKGGDNRDITIKLHDRGGDRPISDLASDEKGALGELLTKMTMFSYGYDSYPTKYMSSQGIDNLFLSNSRDYLFLSQSKFGSSSKLASATMEKELNERAVCKRLSKMRIYGSDAVRESRELVLHFIAESPTKIHKLAHCIFNNGYADFCVKSFDVNAYKALESQLLNARLEDKIEGVSAALKTFEPDPLGQLQLALGSIPLNRIPPKLLRECLLSAAGMKESEIVSMMSVLSLPEE